MQLSTDFPCGMKGIQSNLASGVAPTRNVSLEADTAFMRELQQVDPRRYRRLIHNMQETAPAQPLTERELDKRQANWDKMAAKRAAKTGNLPTGWLWCAYEFCKLPFRPVRKTTIHCSPRCKRRWEQNQSASVLQELAS